MAIIKEPRGIARALLCRAVTVAMMVNADKSSGKVSKEGSNGIGVATNLTTERSEYSGGRGEEKRKKEENIPTSGPADGRKKFRQGGLPKGGARSQGIY